MGAGSDLPPVARQAEVHPILQQLADSLDGERISCLAGDTLDRHGERQVSKAPRSLGVALEGATYAGRRLLVDLHPGLGRAGPWDVPVTRWNLGENAAGLELRAHAFLHLDGEVLGVHARVRERDVLLEVPVRRILSRVLYAHDPAAEPVADHAHVDQIPRQPICLVDRDGANVGVRKKEPDHAVELWAPLVLRGVVLLEPRHEIEAGVDTHPVDRRVLGVDRVSCHLLLITRHSNIGHGFGGHMLACY